MNKTSALEWLKKAYHDLTSAQILYNANHYTDSIGVDLQYAIEKTFKAILAYENKKITKTHDLNELYALTIKFIKLNDNDLDIINIATEYHIQEAYPQFERPLPPRKEIKEVLNFTEILFEKVCNILDINLEKVKE